MKLIKSSYEILEQSPGLKGIYKAIEVAGRTCYRSLDKITDDSAEGFVNRMIASKHYAMLEHGTVYLKIRKGTYAYSHYVVVCEPDDDFMSSSRELSYRPYTKVNIQDDYIYVTTNLRVLQEHNWLDDLKYLCEPTEFHEKRVTVRFTTSNSIMREFTRHRVFSFAVESTRYCNYNKDKFNKELTFVIPSWSGLKEGAISYLLNMQTMWDSLQYTDGTIIKDNYPKGIIDIVYSWNIAESMYMNGTLDGLTAQQAREVLPLATKCDMIMTGFVSDWEHLCKLRSSFAETGQPHPDMKALVDPLLKEFINRGYMKPFV